MAISALGQKQRLIPILAQRLLSGNSGRSTQRKTPPKRGLISMLFLALLVLALLALLVLTETPGLPVAANLDDLIPLACAYKKG